MMSITNTLGAWGKVIIYINLIGLVFDLGAWLKFTTFYLKTLKKSTQDLYVPRKSQFVLNNLIGDFSSRTLEL